MLTPEPSAWGMQVLVLGDTHGSRKAVIEALRRADRIGCSALLSVGDFGIWPGSSGKEFLDTIGTAAQRRGIPVYVVPGNHDDYDQLDAADPDDDGWLVLRDMVRAAPRGLTWVWQGVTFLALGGTASSDGPGGIFPQVRGPLDKPATLPDSRMRVAPRPAGFDLGGWWPQERITDDDVATCLDAVSMVEAAGRRVGVMITHDAPVRVEMTSDKKHAAGEEQRARIQQVVDAAGPDVLVCGHWHLHTRQWLRTPRGVTDVVVLAAADEAVLPYQAVLWLQDGAANVGVSGVEPGPRR